MNFRKAAPLHIAATLQATVGADAFLMSDRRLTGAARVEDTHECAFDFLSFAAPLLGGALVLAGVTGLGMERKSGSST